LLGRIAARLAGVPRVVSGIRVAERRTPWPLRLDRWTDRWVNRHVAVSQAVAQFSHEVGGLPAEKMVVIPNGVDLSKFEQATPADLTSLGLSANERAMVCIGRLDPQKRLDWLLRLMPNVFAAETRWQLLIVGYGNQRAMLEVLASDLEISSRVHFLGFRDDIPAILAASEVLLLPSAWEGMPNVVLEAMASARPVLATDVEGVRELLGPGAVAQIVPLDEPDHFATRLLELLRDPQTRQQLGTANHCQAARFLREAMIGRYARLYIELCEKS
jgi:starch synthase (maltosyl-transferring)